MVIGPEGHRATIVGTATLNGQAGYHFCVTVGDSKAAKVRPGLFQDYHLRAQGILVREFRFGRCRRHDHRKSCIRRVNDALGAEGDRSIFVRLVAFRSAKVALLSRSERRQIFSADPKFEFRTFSLVCTLLGVGGNGGGFWRN